MSTGLPRRSMLTGAALLGAVGLSGCGFISALNPKGQAGAGEAQCLPGDQSIPPLPLEWEEEQASIIPGAHAPDENNYLQPSALGVSPDGRRAVALQSSDRNHLGKSPTVGAVVWSLENGSIEKAFDNGDGWYAAWSPVGDRIAVGQRNYLALMDSSGSRQFSLVPYTASTPLPSAFFASFCFNRTGSVLASIHSDDRLRVWDLSDDACSPVRMLDVREHVPQVLDFSPHEDNLLAVGTQKGPIQLWDTAAGTLVDEISVEGVGHGDVKFLPSGELVVSYRYTNVIAHVSRAAGLISTITVGAHQISSIDVNAEGKVVIAGSQDGEVWTWDLTNSPVQLPSAAAEIGAITWAGTDGRIVAVSEQKGLLIFDGAQWAAADLPD